MSAHPAHSVRRHARIARLAATLALAGVLGACVVVPADPYYGPAVAVAPPAAVVEPIPVVPGPGYFWIGGYWNWVGNRHVWVGGHWEAHRPGWGWTPHRWVQGPRGWHAVPGRWERR